MRKLTLFGGLFLLLTSTAHADTIADFAVFGNTGVSWNGGTVSGLTGSNGDVNVGVFSTLSGVEAGGSLNIPSGGFVTVNGPVAVNGNVFLNTFGTINGNVTAGGNVTVGFVATINGNVTYGGTLSNSGTISGTTTNSPGIMPFSNVTVPPATSFTAGGPNVNVPTFGNVTLPPGSYGALSFGTPPFGDSTLNLSSGNYFFTSITANGSDFNNLNLNFTNGPINIFVTGNVDLGGAFTTEVNGGPGGNADPNLASTALLESLGDVSVSGFFTTTTFFGTIFTPNGDISTGFDSHFIGELIAGGAINSSSTSINGVPSGFFQAPAPAVPEPGSLLLWGLPLLGLFGLRRLRKRAA